MVERFLSFVAGAIVGSFVSVLASRFQTQGKKSIIWGRSRCPRCRKTLAWHELIPLISYLVLAGRCRNCKKAIAISYPLVELSLGVISLLAFVQFGFSLMWFVFLLYFGALVAIALYDSQTQEVPDAFVLVALALGLIFVALSPALIFKQAFAGLALSAGVIGALVLLGRGKWMGVGDIGVAGAVGVALGVKGVIVALYLAFIIGAVFAIGLLATKRAKRKSAIAFAPFLVAGGAIAFFWSGVVLKLIWF